MEFFFLFQTEKKYLPTYFKWEKKVFSMIDKYPYVLDLWEYPCPIDPIFDNCMQGRSKQGYRGMILNVSAIKEMSKRTDLDGNGPKVAGMRQKVPN